MSYTLAPPESGPDPIPQSTESQSTASPPHPSKQRLLSLDAYRGLIMISLAFGGFGLAKTAGNVLEVVEPAAREVSDPKLWGVIDANAWRVQLWKQAQVHFSHVDWVGCGYWDLIQPSFMFMVGVSMAYSYAKRRQLGHSYFRMFAHALFRSIVLILLGVFLLAARSQLHGRGPAVRTNDPGGRHRFDVLVGLSVDVSTENICSYLGARLS